MQSGAITGYIDVAQLVLYAFWIFFAGLVLYLRREDKREGYPLESDLTERTGGRVVAVGFPSMPQPKTFRLHDGSTVQAPRRERDTRVLNAEPAAGFPGAPLRPTGDPMKAEVGPGAYAQRADRPDLTIEGEPRIVPLRTAADFTLEARDPNPIGMPVIGADRRVAGTVCDVWVDRMEVLVRYLELEVDAGGQPRRVMLPINFTRVDDRRAEVRVSAILAAQFAAVPALGNPDRITLLEEERVTAYYGAGTLYATPARTESLL